MLSLPLWLWCSGVCVLSPRAPVPAGVLADHDPRVGGHRQTAPGQVLHGEAPEWVADEPWGGGVSQGCFGMCVATTLL